MSRMNIILDPLEATRASLLSKRRIQRTVVLANLAPDEHYPRLRIQRTVVLAHLAPDEHYPRLWHTTSRGLSSQEHAL
jgi:hypothetical protein